MGPHFVCHVIHVYLAKILLLILVRAAGPCFSLAGGICKFYVAVLIVDLSYAA